MAPTLRLETRYYHQLFMRALVNNLSLVQHDDMIPPGIQDPLPYMGNPASRVPVAAAHADHEENHGPGKTCREFSATREDAPSQQQPRILLSSRQRKVDQFSAATWPILAPKLTRQTRNRGISLIERFADQAVASHGAHVSDAIALRSDPSAISWLASRLPHH